MAINFRYLIPEPIYDELIQLAIQGHEEKGSDCEWLDFCG